MDNSFPKSIGPFHKKSSFSQNIEYDINKEWEEYMGFKIRWKVSKIEDGFLISWTKLVNPGGMFHVIMDDWHEKVKTKADALQILQEKIKHFEVKYKIRKLI